MPLCADCIKCDERWFVFCMPIALNNDNRMKCVNWKGRGGRGRRTLDSQIIRGLKRMLREVATRGRKDSNQHTKKRNFIEKRSKQKTKPANDLWRQQYNNNYYNNKCINYIQMKYIFRCRISPKTEKKKTKHIFRFSDFVCGYCESNKWLCSCVFRVVFFFLQRNLNTNEVHIKYWKLCTQRWNGQQASRMNKKEPRQRMQFSWLFIRDDEKKLFFCVYVSTCREFSGRY